MTDRGPPTEPVSEPYFSPRLVAEPPEPISEPPPYSPSVKDEEDGEWDRTVPFSRFLHQSEYGPLSHVLTFLPIVEMLPLRRVSRFLQRVVRVAVGIIEISDADLLDLNFRFAQFVITKLHRRLPRDIHRPIQGSDDDDEEGEEEGENSPFDLPPELLSSFGFLASTETFSLINVKMKTPQNRVFLNLVVSNSLLSTIEDPTNDDYGSSRLAYLAWAFCAFLTSLCGIYTASARNFEFQCSDEKSSYYRRGNVFVYFEKPSSPRLSLLSDDVPIRVGGGGAVMEEEEEEEGEDSTKKSGSALVRVSLYRATVEYDIMPRSATMSRKGEWGTASVGSFLGMCDHHHVEFPLFPETDLSYWLCQTHPPGFLPLIKSADHGLAPVVVHFLHHLLLKEIRHMGGTSWGALFQRSSFQWGQRDAKRLIDLIMGLLHMRPAKNMDPRLEFLRTVFETPIGWWLEGGRGKKKGVLRGKWKASGLSVLATIVLDLMEEIKAEFGPSCSFVILTKTQADAQLRGMIKMNSENNVLGWNFLLQDLGVSYDDRFQNGVVNPMMEAVQEGAEHVVNYFAKRSGSLGRVRQLVDGKGRNLLHHAVLRDDPHDYYYGGKQTKTVRNTLRLRGELAWERDENGDTPMEFALYHDMYENAKFLLNNASRPPSGVEKKKVRWDLTRFESPRRVFTAVLKAGPVLFRKLEGYHEVIFPASLRYEAFVEACGNSAIETAKLLVPLAFGKIPQSVPLEVRQKAFVRACDSKNLEVVEFVLSSVPLELPIADPDETTDDGEETSKKSPLFYAARSRNAAIVEKVIATRPSQWESTVLPHFREAIPSIALHLLSDLPSNWKVLTLLDVFGHLIKLCDVPALDKTVSVLIEEHSLASEFFVPAAKFCPQVLDRFVEEVSLEFKQELFCDAVERKDSQFASNLIVNLGLNASCPIPNEVAGLRGGCLLCKSHSPLCLAAHAKMSEVVSAGLSTFGERATAEAATVVKCLLSLPFFVLLRANEKWDPVFRVIIDKCPGFVGLVVGDESIGWLGGEKKRLFQEWIESCGEDGASIVGEYSAFFGV